MGVEESIDSMFNKIHCIRLVSAFRKIKRVQFHFWTDSMTPVE